MWAPAAWLQGSSCGCPGAAACVGPGISRQGCRRGTRRTPPGVRGSSVSHHTSLSWEDLGQLSHSQQFPCPVPSGWVNIYLHGRFCFLGREEPSFFLGTQKCPCPGTLIFTQSFPSSLGPCFSLPKSHDFVREPGTPIPAAQSSLHPRGHSWLLDVVLRPCVKAWSPGWPS